MAVKVEICRKILSILKSYSNDKINRRCNARAAIIEKNTTKVQQPYYCNKTTLLSHCPAKKKLKSPCPCPERYKFPRKSSALKSHSDDKISPLIQ